MFVHRILQCVLSFSSLIKFIINSDKLRDRTTVYHKCYKVCHSHIRSAIPIVADKYRLEEAIVCANHITVERIRFRPCVVYYYARWLTPALFGHMVDKKKLSCSFDISIDPAGVFPIRIKIFFCFSFNCRQ